MKLSNKTKGKLGRITFLYKAYVRIRARFRKYKIEKIQPTNINTIYVVSPYKTGTTYLDSLWNERVSRYEPFHVYTLNFIEQNLSHNFPRRKSLLNLKLETTGALSLFLRDLPKPNQPYSYLYILRPPSKWIHSVIKYWSLRQNHNWDYINEFFWKRLLHYDMKEVIANNDKQGMKKLVDDLEKIYFNLLNDALSNQAIYFVEIKDLDELAISIGKRIGIPPDFDRSWKRVTKKIPELTIPLDKKIDEKYEYFLDNHLKERLYPFKK